MNRRIAEEPEAFFFPSINQSPSDSPSRPNGSRNSKHRIRLWIVVDGWTVDVVGLRVGFLVAGDCCCVVNVGLNPYTFLMERAC